MYLNKDRSQSETLLRKVERMGAKAVMFTVDTAGDSKRTLDERLKVAAAAKMRQAAAAAAEEKPDWPVEPSQPAPMAVGHAISGYQDRNLTWKDIGFIRVSGGGEHVTEIISRGTLSAANTTSRKTPSCP